MSLHNLLKYVLEIPPPSIAVRRDRRTPHEWRVVVRGELDAFSAPLFLHQMQAALDGPEALCLDLNDVTFCDHAGLRALRSIEAAERPGRITVTTAHPSVDLVLRLCGIEMLMGYAPPSHPPG